MACLRSARVTSSSARGAGDTASSWSWSCDTSAAREPRRSSVSPRASTPSHSARGQFDVNDCCGKKYY